MKRIYLFLAFLGCATFALSQSIDTLSRVINLDAETDLKGLALMDASVAKAKVVLNGEIHFVSSNTKVQLKMLEYLSQKEERVILIGEYPNSYAYFINRYLGTGDTVYLRKVMYQYGTFNSEDYFQLLVGIHQLNQRLPKEKRIGLMGVDMEYTAKFGSKWVYWALGELTVGKSIPATIQPELKSFLALSRKDTLSEHEVELKIRTLQHSIQVNQSVYTELLGREFIIFKGAVEDLVAVFTVFKGKGGGLSRDKWMYERLCQLQKDWGPKLGNVRYYGSFGSFHVDNWSKYSMAGRLNRNKKSPFQANVVAIAPCYLNSRRGLSKGDTIVDFCMTKTPAALESGTKASCQLQRAGVAEQKRFQFLMRFANYPAMKKLPSSREAVMVK